MAVFGLETGRGGPYQRRLRKENEWENFENRQVFFVSLHVYRPKVKDTTDIIQIKSKYAEVFRQVIRLF